MSTTGGDWKNVAEYDYFDELTPEQTAYEFLRRNEDYVAAYKAAADAPATEHERAALAAHGAVETGAGRASRAASIGGGAAWRWCGLALRP